MQYSMKRIPLFIGAFAIVVVMAPGLALANNDNGDGKNNRGQDDRFGVRVFDNNGSDHGRKIGRDHKVMGSIFYTGTVTAMSDSGFTMTTKADGSLTVNTEVAKLIRVPRLAITLSDIQVGDKVFVTGTKTGSTITASAVYDKSENIRPGKVKGTITATSDSSLTVQKKNGTEVTVNTDSNTKIMTKDGEAVSLADIGLGATVKVFGLWDQILNIFSALKITIK